MNKPDSLSRRIRSIAVDARASAGTSRERWASPAELAGKRILGAGQYSATAIEAPHCPTPQFLRKNPDYLANHPFDGVAIPIRLPTSWCKRQGLTEGSGYALHDFVFTAIPLDDAAIASSRNDLRAVRWAHCTENRLWVTVRDGTRAGETDRKAPVATDRDWGTVCRNIALVAKLARETGMVGLVVDTEMYTNYASGELYPYGKFDRSTWRRRGRKWIDAVQSAFPGISLLFFFSWGPEHEPGGWPGYENLKPFMDGILDNIRDPAEIIHGWESTFWFGGQRRMPGGEFRQYPGDRKTFAETAKGIRDWRRLSAAPARYDRFVRVGMGAWVESDPWNLYPGWPTGRLDELPWSNLPITLAYSDGTVWVWSQHTDYPRTKEARNPFLWSLANQTRNRSRTPKRRIMEAFESDPTARGWAFDYDMLDAGKPLHNGFLPVFDTQTLGYEWDPLSKALWIRGTWPGGSRLPHGHRVHRQRRRYFLPINPIPGQAQSVLRLDFQVSGSNGSPGTAPILGIFHHDRYVDDHSVGIQILGPGQLLLRLGHKGVWHETPLSTEATVGAGAVHRVRIAVDRAQITAELHIADVSTAKVQAKIPLPMGFSTRGLDEIGAAYPDLDDVPARAENQVEIRLSRLQFERN